MKSAIIDGGLGAIVMLDWRVITEHIKRSETLSVADLMRELADLRAKSPDIGHEVTRYFSRKNRANTFMRTSISDEAKQNALLTEGTALGVWDIAEHIGSGGMGDVYKAKRNDGLYDQIVALKVIQRGDKDSLGRFEEERKRLANLEHPGISRIIDGGATQDGDPFMVMEYHDGVPIDEFVMSGKLSRQQILKLFKPLCASTAYAHSKLILHRDIKANNVLVDASSAVKLIDFGIAAAIGETKDGETGPMTIAYAAPEQLMRKASSVGSDIFALGVLLHQLLTGTPQQRNPDGSVELDHKSLEDADLAAIISKATAFEEGDRYQSVTALADDIDAYLDTRPVLARNGTGLYRFKKLVKRNALASSLAAAFVMALSGGMIGSLVLANKATAEAARANKELVRAEWLRKDSDYNSEIGHKTKDAYQYAISRELDEDVFDQRMIEYLENISTSEREKAPEAVAAKTYVVGSHFLSRNDYVMARKILEPWVQEGTGHPYILALGQGSLAYTYVDDGERQLAGEMFQKAAAYFEGTPGEEKPDYKNFVIQSAFMLEDKEGLEKVRAIVSEAMETEENPYFQMYLTAQLYKIEYQQGNWDAAFKVLQDTVDMIENGAHSIVAGTDTMYLNLAKMHLYHHVDSDRAMQQIERAQSINDNRKGASKETGRILEYRAVIDWMNGDYASALDNISSSIPLFERYTGKNAFYATAMAQQAVIQADMGDFAGASASVDILKTDVADRSGQWPELLDLYILARQKGLESAQSRYDEPNFNKQKIKDNLIQSFYLKALEKDGLKL